MAGSMAAWATLFVLAAADFTWVRERGAEACPDEAQVRAAVAARLGYQPFATGAETRIEARVAPVGSGLRATIEVTRPGAAPGKRELSSRTGDCVELAGALELAI